MLTFTSFPWSVVRENRLGKEGGYLSLPKAQDLPENLPEDKRCDFFFSTGTRGSAFIP